MIYHAFIRQATLGLVCSAVYDSLKQYITFGCGLQVDYRFIGDIDEVLNLVTRGHRRHHSMKHGPHGATWTLSVGTSQNNKVERTFMFCPSEILPTDADERAEFPNTILRSKI